MKRKTIWIIEATVMSLAFLFAVFTIIYTDKSKAFKIAESILGAVYLSLAIYWWIKAFTQTSDDNEEDDEDEPDEK